MLFQRSFKRIMLLVAFITGLLAVPLGMKAEEKKPIRLRIGWQVQLATQGQIVAVLKKTSILKDCGLEGDFKPFDWGGPQIEAALAGQVDVIFVGDQPAITLFAKRGDWKIVSRLFYTRTAVMVPIDSPLRAVADLRGKTVASPFGSVAHREATLKEIEAELDPDKDVKNINMGIQEISSLVLAGGSARWKGVDAVAVWEPSTALFEDKGIGRVLGKTDQTLGAVSQTLGVVAISDKFLQGKNRDAAKLLLASVIKAWVYYSLHKADANKWYIEDAGLAVNNSVLDIAAAYDRETMSARSLVDMANLITLSPTDIGTLQRGAEWALRYGFTKRSVEIGKCIDIYLIKEAREELSRNIHLY